MGHHHRLRNTSFTIAAYENTSGTSNLYAYTNGPFALHLGDLNFGTPIAGVDLTSGISTISGPTVGVMDVLNTGFTANSIDLNFFNLAFGSGDNAPNGAVGASASCPPAPPRPTTCPGLEPTP